MEILKLNRSSRTREYFGASKYHRESFRMYHREETNEMNLIVIGIAIDSIIDNFGFEMKT